MPELYELRQPPSPTPQQLDDLYDHVTVVQTLCSVLHLALVNEHLHPNVDELQTYSLHLWDCAAACTKRLDALLDGEGQP